MSPGPADPSGHPPLFGEIKLIASTPHYVVIDKPAGLLSVPGLGPANQHSAASWCRTTFPHATGPVTVHRLDMHTSGLLLMALDAAAHRHLSRQFEARTTSKSYIAIVDGSPTTDSGTINLPMRPDIDNRPRQIIDFIHGRPATTHYRVLDRLPLHTRLELSPVTGRSHQLRVHCAHPAPAGLGCPIVGDSLYNPANLLSSKKLDVPNEKAPRLHLHAAVLDFDDPVSGLRIHCESPAPF